MVRKAIPGDPHHVNVTAPVRYALAEDESALVDQWVEQALNDLLITDVATPLDAILRRQGTVFSDGVLGKMQFGRLEIDRDARTVTLAGAACVLTAYQFDLLVALAQRAGRVLTRDQIMEAVRGRELEAFDRSIDVHMGRIRAAIEDDIKNPKRILTVRGVGYIFARQQD